MMLDLTPEQSLALHSGQPLRLSDPQSNAVFVLVPEEAFIKVQSLFTDGPLTEAERQSILKGAWRAADWDDPVWDEYAKLLPPGSPQ